ncbi:MAG: GumC family protein [Armatimonadota bacterium]
MPMQKIQDGVQTIPVPSECSGVEEMPVDFSTLWMVIIRRRWISIGVVLVICATGILYTAMQPRVFQATTKIMVDSMQDSHENDQVRVLSELRTLTRSRSIETQVEVISSSDILHDAYQKLSLEQRTKGFSSPATVPEGAVTIFPKRDTDIIEITVQSHEPDSSAALANLVAKEYFEKDLDYSNQATKKAREYVEGQLTSIGQELKAANSALSQFKKQSGLFSPDAQLTIMAERIAALQTEISDANAEIAANSKYVVQLQRMLTEQQEYILSETTLMQNPRTRDSLAAIDAMQRERAMLLQEYTAKSPEVQAVDARLANEQQRVQSLAENIVTSQVKTRNALHDGLFQQYASALTSMLGNKMRLNSLSSSLRKLNSEVQVLPSREQHLIELMQRTEFLQNTSHMLNDKLYSLRLSEQGRLPNGRIVSFARPEPTPIKPKMKTSAILALLLGIISAVLCVIIIERVDDRIHDSSSTMLIPDSVVGEIPRVGDGESCVLDPQAKSFGLLESFRMLRNNIAFLSVDKPIKTIAITSAGSGEGKSTTCVNLAIAMAMEGKRAIVVECDLRCPSLHELLHLSRGTGLTSVITGMQSVEQAIRRSTSGDFDILLAGPLPPNPPEVLNSLQMRRIITALAEQYDIVILDCPPVVGLSDVPVISTLVDGLLLVIRMDCTRQRLLQAAIRHLAQAQARLLGVVINSLDLRHNGYGYYYQNYSHYYQHTVSEGVESREDKPQRRVTR